MPKIVCGRRTGNNYITSDGLTGGVLLMLCWDVCHNCYRYHITGSFRGGANLYYFHDFFNSHEI